jgi:leucyl/phenylalanyl-tRNA--protein transferase
MLFVYEQGAFPMDTLDDDGRFRVAAYRADPRAVLPLGALRLPRTLRRTLPRRGYGLTTNAAFEQVVAACGDRPGLRPDERWLTPRLEASYRDLHAAGHARSFEVWDEDRLVGGCFGVGIGRAHTLESMFHRAPDAGSAAVLNAALRVRDAGCAVLDGQQRTTHTARLGGVEVPEAVYQRQLRGAIAHGLAPLPLHDSAGPSDGGALVRALTA